MYSTGAACSSDHEVDPRLPVLYQLMLEHFPDVARECTLFPRDAPSLLRQNVIDDFLAEVDTACGPPRIHEDNDDSTASAATSRGSMYEDQPLVVVGNCLLALVQCLDGGAACVRFIPHFIRHIEKALLASVRNTNNATTADCSSSTSLPTDSSSSSSKSRKPSDFFGPRQKRTLLDDITAVMEGPLSAPRFESVRAKFVIHSITTKSKDASASASSSHLPLPPRQPDLKNRAKDFEKMMRKQQQELQDEMKANRKYKLMSKTDWLKRHDDYLTLTQQLLLLLFAVAVMCAVEMVL